MPVTTVAERGGYRNANVLLSVYAHAQTEGRRAAAAVAGQIVGGGETGGAEALLDLGSRERVIGFEPTTFCLGIRLWCPCQPSRYLASRGKPLLHPVNPRRSVGRLANN